MMPIKSKIMRSVALIAFATTALASTPAQAVAITGLWNTGVNASGVRLAADQSEIHYKVNGTGTPTTINFGSYVQAADSIFIGELPGGFETSATDTYTLTFDLTGLDAATASISGKFAGDNHAPAFLNGVQIAKTDTFSTLTAFSASSGFLAGLNTLSFVVLDDVRPGPAGLIVSGLTGTAATAPVVGGVPEPATWALMIGGFAMTGFAARRRERHALAA